jgi:S1-C subfamily serine protease
MIITTSGSSAGIGFAVPSDNVKEFSDRIVELDKERQLRKVQRKGKGWLGIEVATSSLETSLRERLTGSLRPNSDETFPGAFVTAIVPDSPIAKNEDGGTISVTSISSGNIRLGDRIINLGGCCIANGQGFANEMRRRVEGEQLSLTIETVDGKKKIVYVTLGRIPL